MKTFKDLSEKALEEMEKWLEEGESEISFEEAKERIQYYLDMMGIK